MFNEDVFSDEYPESIDKKSTNLTQHHAFEYRGEMYFIGYIRVFDQAERRKIVIPISVCTMDEHDNAIELIPMPDRIVDAAIEEIEREGVLCQN